VVLGDQFDASELWIESTGNDAHSRPCGDSSITGEYRARLDIRVSLPDEGWVFLADSWYPGWTAQVNGEEVNVEVANAFFRAVRVPAGEHDVTFAYRPLPFRWGLAITAGTLAALLMAPPCPDGVHSAAAAADRAPAAGGRDHLTGPEAIISISGHSPFWRAAVTSSTF